jgi:hypothetical protein
LDPPLILLGKFGVSSLEVFGNNACFQQSSFKSTMKDLLAAFEKLTVSCCKASRRSHLSAVTRMGVKQFAAIMVSRCFRANAGVAA